MTPTLLNNRYKIIQALATGGFGHTFLAEDSYLPSRRRCVIKQLIPVTNNPQVYPLVQGRFQREAAILEKLGEANHQIPKLYAYFEEGGQFYLVEEWVEGQTLVDKVEAQGTLSDRAVQNLLLDILPVLDFIHKQGIIHRDVKPDNIILRQRDGKPVLIDFGAVKEVMTTVVNSQGHPTHSIVIGSPGFMPMEQAAGHPIYSSDLYSLGLTAIYLLTGKLPQALGMDSQTGEFIWRQYAPNLSPKLAAVLDKAIQSHPRDRYPTAQQMLDDLQSAPKHAKSAAVSQQATVAISPRGTGGQSVQIPNPSKVSGEWKKGWAIAGSIIFASLIIGVVFARPRQPSPQPAPEQPVARRTPATEPAISPPPETTAPLPREPVTSTPPAPQKTEPSPQEPVTSTPAAPQEIEPLPQEPVASPPSPRVPLPEEATPTPQAQLPEAIPPTQDNQSAPIPNRGSIPAFPIGTPRSVVESTLGSPTKISKGAFGNTRAVSYEDYVPGEVSLGYLFDRKSGQIRQTEVAFSQSVELAQMQATFNEMLGGRATAEIEQKLRRVYQRRSNYSSFAIGDLKGEIQRNKSDRIYIGVWDANLH